MLRPLEPEDLDLLYTIENNPATWNVGSAHVPYSKYALKQFIATTQNDLYLDRQLRLVICNEQQQTVGLIDLFDFHPQHMRAEVGIAILEQYQNQGYALQALQQLEEYATQQFNLHQLYAYVPANNPASVKLFTKAGFQHAGLLSDWVFQQQKYLDVHFFQKKMQKKQENPC